MTGEGDRRRATIYVVLGAVALCALVLGPLWLLVRAPDADAAFGDSADLGPNRLGAGSIEIAIGESSARLRAPNMAPGDRVTGWVDVVHLGDLPLRYGVSATAVGDPLGAALRWDVWVAASCAGAADHDPFLVESGTLGPGTAEVWVGDPAPGADPGDRDLEPGERERLCLAATMPIDTPDAFQGQRVELLVTVSAEHRVPGSP